MKNLIFEKLELLSLTEGKARAIKFHPRLTVITGENGVGKSSIIKSIYWVLGATAAVVNSKWTKANVKGSLTFTVDGQRFTAVRNHAQIAIFSEAGDRMISTQAFTKELGPFFAKLLDFGLLLPNRSNGNPETPPPAYAFLPFYVDQDGGWTKPLASFDRLTQYPDFKKKVIEFHAGIRPNRYYELNAQRKQLDLAIKELEHDHRVARSILERLHLDDVFTGLELSISDHEASVEILLRKLKDLRDVRQARAIELADVLDERIALDQQVALVQAAAAELAHDAQWAADDGRNEIPCPTCGTHHQNDFSNRFAILADREECFKYIAGAQHRIKALVERVQESQKLISSADGEIAQIEEILQQRQGDVTLKQVIENEGRRIAADTFKKQLKALETKISDSHTKISIIKDMLKELEDKALRKKIEDYYADLIYHYLRELNVSDPDLESVSKITGRVVDTGSEQPRLLLAYVLALADTIHKYTSAFTAPLVIDSPVQQEQDRNNAPAIIAKVLAKRPNGGQSIIGTISLHGVELTDCNVFAVHGKNSALLASEYQGIHEKLVPLLDRMSLVA